MASSRSVEMLPDAGNGNVAKAAAETLIRNGNGMGTEAKAAAAAAGGGVLTVVNDEEFLQALVLTSASCLPMAMKAALELNVLKVLSKAKAAAEPKQQQQQHLTPLQIVERLEVNIENPNAHAALDRILRVLACHGVLSCHVVDGERRYALTPVAEHLVGDDDDGGSLAPLLLMNHDKVFMDTWQHLQVAVTEGSQPFVKAHGVHAFEYPARDERFNAVFNRAMAQHSRIMMGHILRVYRGFAQLSSLLDVGGGVGLTSALIVEAHPHVKATNFDMPHVVSTAPAHPGVVHLGGDMFDSVPPAQTILMKMILHDWSDELCVRLLKNCHKALPEKGKVIVIDHLLPVAAESATWARDSFHVDLLMLAYNPGGKERTEHEFRNLALQAGFTGGVSLVCCVNGIWVMEFYK